jgi:hypothetical protein
VRYANAEGQQVSVVFRRGGEVLTRSGAIRVRTERTVHLKVDPNATPAARAILAGITGHGPGAAHE